MQVSLLNTDQTIHRITSWMFCAAVFSLVGLTTGCGSGGSKVTLSGQISFDEQPVPGGSLIFTLTSPKKGTKTQFSSQIHKGEFALSDPDLEAGAYWIQVFAVDGKQDATGDLTLNYQKKLFPTLQCSVDLPAGDLKLQLSVAKSHGEAYEIKVGVANSDGDPITESSTNVPRGVSLALPQVEILSWRR